MGHFLLLILVKLILGGSTNKKLVLLKAQRLVVVTKQPIYKRFDIYPKNISIQNHHCAPNYKITRNADFYIVIPSPWVLMSI